MIGAYIAHLRLIEIKLISSSASSDKSTIRRLFLTNQSSINF